MRTHNFFRSQAAREEQLIRASMPRLSAANPEPLPRFGQDESGPRRREGKKLPPMRPLHFTIAEVAHV